MQKMKKLGLVGGMSWVPRLSITTVLSMKVSMQGLGGLYYAECLIYSVNFHEFVTNNTAGKWDNTFLMLLDACRNLEKSGRRSNCTLRQHRPRRCRSFGNRNQSSDHPYRNRDRHGDQRGGLRKVGLLGTKFTMEMDFYKDKLASAGIDPIVRRRRKAVILSKNTLRDELGKGIIREETKRRYLAIIDELIGQGAEGIILGCTEIPMIISQDDVPVPVFDTTRIHSDAARRFAWRSECSSNFSHQLKQLLCEKSSWTWPSAGKDIWLRLAIYLVILGEGKPVFSAIQNRVNLKLENVKSSPLGSLCWNIEK